jgi:hypothetical protein
MASYLQIAGEIPRLFGRRMCAKRSFILGIAIAFVCAVSVSSGEWAGSSLLSSTFLRPVKYSLVHKVMADTPPRHYATFATLRLRGGGRSSDDTDHKKRDRSEKDSDLPGSGKVSKKSKDRERKGKDDDEEDRVRDRKKRKHGDDDDDDGHKRRRRKRDEEDASESSGDKGAKDARVSSYRISAETSQALANKNITSLFPIQIATFDLVYDGYDLIARARTGTGKTLGFVLPVHERLLALR